MTIAIRKRHYMTDQNKPLPQGHIMEYTKTLRKVCGSVLGKGAEGLRKVCGRSAEGKRGWVRVRKGGGSNNFV